MGRYYRECPYCGVNLDPGEPCDCEGWIAAHQEIVGAVHKPIHVISGVRCDRCGDMDAQTVSFETDNIALSGNLCRNCITVFMGQAWPEFIQSKKKTVRSCKHGKALQMRSVS